MPEWFRESPARHVQQAAFVQPALTAGDRTQEPLTPCDRLVVKSALYERV